MNIDVDRSFSFSYIHTHVHTYIYIYIYIHIYMYIKATRDLFSIYVHQGNTRFVFFNTERYKDRMVDIDCACFRLILAFKVDTSIATCLKQLSHL